MRWCNAMALSALLFLAVVAVVLCPSWTDVGGTPYDEYDEGLRNGC